MQVTFIDFIVDPLWETWAELVYPDGQVMLDNMAKTREYWNAKIEPTSSDESGSDDGGDRASNGPAMGGKVFETAVFDECGDNHVTCLPPTGHMVSGDSHVTCLPPTGHMVSGDNHVTCLPPTSHMVSGDSHVTCLPPTGHMVSGDSHVTCLPPTGHMADNQPPRNTFAESPVSDRRYATS